MAPKRIKKKAVLKKIVVIQSFTIDSEGENSNFDLDQSATQLPKSTKAPATSMAGTALQKPDDDSVKEDSITDSEFDGLDDSTPELDGEMPARAGPSSMVTPIQPTRARRNAPKAAEAHQTESEDEDRETEDSPVKTRVVASSKAKATQLPKSTKARKPMESKETNKAGTSSASSNAQMTHLNDFPVPKKHTQADVIRTVAISLAKSNGKSSMQAVKRELNMHHNFDTANKQNATKVRNTLKAMFEEETIVPLRKAEGKPAVSVCFKLGKQDKPKLITASKRKSLVMAAKKKKQNQAKASKLKLPTVKKAVPAKKTRKVEGELRQFSDDEDVPPEYQ